MNKQLQSQILRFVLLVIIQIVILKQIPIEFGGFPLLLFLYPLFLILMPTDSPKQLLIIMGFVIGITLDMFYDSPLGVHAGAGVFTGFVRGFGLRLVGVEETKLPVPSIAALEFGKFARFAGFLLLVHIFVYYVFDVFTFVFIKEILLKTLGSFVFSFPLLLAVALITNTKR